MRLRMRSNSDVPFWTWGKIAAVFAGLTLIPIIWLLAARLLGLSSSTTGNDFSLLATIGGVMGAIFTVGGLVIALVAIITQLGVEERVKKAVSDARSELDANYRATREEFEHRYEAELLPELIKRAKRQVQAEIAFFHVTMTDISDWKTAEAYTLQALENDPDLENARSFLALRLSQIVINGFSLQHSHGYALGIQSLYGDSYGATLSNTLVDQLTLPTYRLLDTSLIGFSNMLPRELPIVSTSVWEM